MGDAKPQHTVEPTDEKPAVVAHIDDKSELGPDKHAAVADYTGAARKSDPEEIALVRKIDWRLMVCFHLLISGKQKKQDLGISSDTISANTHGHVLPELCRQKRNCASATQQS